MCIRDRYKDLPVRFAEFGTVYRYEQSGELHGLTRVRGFTQDDAHLFCDVYKRQACLLFQIWVSACLNICVENSSYYFKF